MKYFTFNMSNTHGHFKIWNRNKINMTPSKRLQTTTAYRLAYVMRIDSVKGQLSETI